MATAAITAERENYLNQEYGIKSWLLTVDHKRIALLYLLSITFFFFIGGFFALLIRLELLTPAGDLVQADTYNKLFTMHGQVMVFFFLIPSIPAVLGNFLVPLMIGAKDLAFPRINLLSWYLYIIAGVLMLHCMLTGGVDTGWTFYTPFSTAFSNTKVIEAGLAIFISGFSSILTGLNFVVTIHRMRAPGMTWNRLPLFIWAHYATSIIQLLEKILAVRRHRSRDRAAAKPGLVLRRFQHDNLPDHSGVLGAAIFGAEQMIDSRLGGTKPGRGVAPGQNVLLDAEGRNIKAVDDVLRGQDHLHVTAHGYVQFVDLALAFFVLQLPHPLLGHDVDFGGAARWRPLPEVDHRAP